MSIVNKPWGHYEDLYRDGEVVFKRIVVKPGQSLSYQRHAERTEFWIVTEGEGTVRTSEVGIDDPIHNHRTTRLQPGSYILVPVGMPHQLSNIGEEDLVVYEMQGGDPSEDDIERLEDPHGRV